MKLGIYHKFVLFWILAVFSGILSAMPVVGGTVNINPGWRFHRGGIEDVPVHVNYDDNSWDLISLPHSDALFGFHVTDFREQGRDASWYRRVIVVPKDWLTKRLTLEFQGAMQTTSLWVNGTKVGEYKAGGFDSFHFDITEEIRAGTNVIAVLVDNRRNPLIPPDGVPMDYVLFGGLYRDVFLHVTDTVHLTFPWEGRDAGVRITLPKVSEKEATIRAESFVRNDSDRPRRCTLVTEIRDAKGPMLKSMTSEMEIAPHESTKFVDESEPLSDPILWSPDNPYLYRVVTIVREGDKELDRTENKLGIRWVKFDKDEGFFLNGKHIKLVGANRHQTWPFIGGAVPNGLQRRDAEQMKAMGINWVRLSHYPQDPDFLDMLDELGMMALEEPATWMQKGPEQWGDNLEKSFRSMIRRDRNHPCIILWGPYVNHGGAEPRLVKAAMEEDPTRDRAQDTVPTPMNFVPRIITGNGALAVEHTGHTFPTARGARSMAYRVMDENGGHVVTNINREYEQAKRHWEQLNAAYQKADNAGLAVWCMYDYNTFHNMDEQGLVWHGVCDLFRIPKYSYWWHKSELNPEPMVYVVRVDSTTAAVFSNCERVRLLRKSEGGFEEVATQAPDTSYTTQSGEVVKYALKHPPFHFTVPSVAQELKAEGLTDGKVVAVYHWRQFGAPIALTLEADRSSIVADGADLSRIIVSAVDTNGTVVEDCSVPINIEIEGLGQLIGENPVALRAGKMIILAQSGFVPGELTITASAAGLQAAKVAVTTQPVPADVDLPKDLPRQPTRRTIMGSPQFEAKAIGKQ